MSASSAASVSPATSAVPPTSSTSATLASLAVSPLALTPAFSPDVHDYVMHCAAGTNTLSVSWTTAAGVSVTLVAPPAGDASTGDAMAGNGPSTSADSPPDAASQDNTEHHGAAPAATTTSYDSSPGPVAIRLAENQAAILRVQTSSQESEYWVRCLPPDFPVIAVTQNPSAGVPTDGLYLVGTTIVGPGDGFFAMVLDVRGTPIWYRRAPAPVFNVALVAPNVLSYMSNSPTAGFGSDPTARYELHDLSNQKTTYVNAVDGPTDLHEFRTLANGHRLVMSYHLISGVDLTGLQSYGPNSTVADCVLEEIDQSGALVWTWRGTDHIDVIRESTFPTTPTVNGMMVIDIFHFNSVDEAANGDLLVSARHLDAVFLISKSTGTIVWKMGGAPYNHDGAQLLRLEGDGGFFRQHDARFISSDSIALFDDETGMTAPARAVAFSIDLGAGTATRLWQRLGTVPSGAMGSTRLESDNHVVVGWGSSSGKTAFTEFDEAGNDVLDVAFPNGEESYRAIKVSSTSFDPDTLRQSVTAE
jgi:hypothetical protein